MSRGYEQISALRSSNQLMLLFRAICIVFVHMGRIISALEKPNEQPFQFVND